MTEPTRNSRGGVARATLEIETSGRSPDGVLITADGRELAFSGWAELGAAIDDWRTGARSGVQMRGGDQVQRAIASERPVPSMGGDGE